VGRVEVLVCDLCKKTQEEKPGIHWTARFGGPVLLSFKGVPGVQTEISYDILCPYCANQLLESIRETVQQIKSIPL